MSLPWSPAVASVDASLHGFGVTEKAWPPAEVGRVGRASERGRYRGALRTSRRPRCLVEGEEAEPSLSDIVDASSEQLRALGLRSAFEEVPSALARGGDWGVVAARRWRRKDKILALEAEAALWQVRRLARSRLSAQKRHLVLSDSMAWVLTSCKGRSSSWYLLRRCREFCAMSLALGARVSFRWIPSEWNSADEPSRRGYAGQRALLGFASSSRLDVPSGGPLRGLSPRGSPGPSPLLCRALVPAPSQRPSRAPPAPSRALRPRVAPETEGGVAGGRPRLEGIALPRRHACPASPPPLQPALAPGRLPCRALAAAGPLGLGRHPAPGRLVPYRGETGSARRQRRETARRRPGSALHSAARSSEEAEVLGFHISSLAAAAVTPTTQGNCLNALRKLLAWMHESRAPQRLPACEWGLLLEQYVEFLRDRGLPEGGAASTLAAVRWALPELPRPLRRGLPLATAAVTGWRRLEKPLSRPPVPRSLAVLMALRLCADGKADYALFLLLTFEACMRPSEGACRFWAILIRASELDVLGKTGEFDTSVALDLPRHRLLEPALRLLKANRGERERLFMFCYTDFLLVWNSYLLGLGLAQLKVTPYSLHATMLKHSVFVDLFAGTAPVSRYLRRKGYACIAFDKLQGPQFDLSRREVVLTIAGWLRAGLVWALWFATPCITTTRARTDKSGRMPPPLRSSEHYRGLPDLSARHRAQVRDANSLIDSGGRLQQLAWDLGICCGEENPQTSILWCFPSRRRALARGSAVDVDFCAAGGPLRKRTKLVFQHCGAVEVCKRLREEGPEQASAGALAANALATVPPVDVAQVPTAPTLRRACWRCRHKRLDAQLMQGADPDVELDFSSVETLSPVPALKKIGDQDFLLYDSGVTRESHRILCYGTKDNVEFLNNCSLWLADGTFRIAPEPLRQVHAVHGYDRGYTLPGLYFLLTDKSEKTYKHVWDQVFLMLPDGPEPEVSLLVDYEQAAFKAAEKSFLDINVGGCWMHFAGALWKHVQSLGLAGRFRDDRDFRFRARFQDAETPFLKCFEQAWIGERKRNGERKPPLFPHELWNVHMRCLEEKVPANNMAELFHRHRADRFHHGQKRPYFPKFVELVSPSFLSGGATTTVNGLAALYMKHEAELPDDGGVFPEGEGEEDDVEDEGGLVSEASPLGSQAALRELVATVRKAKEAQLDVVELVQERGLLRDLRSYVLAFRALRLEREYDGVLRLHGCARAEGCAAALRR
ncbi:unnamed protein product, partial [Prorocentrum cordatum]